MMAIYQELGAVMTGRSAARLTGVSRATVMTLDRLDMPVMDVASTDEGQTITAEAGDRTVEKISRVELHARFRRRHVKGPAGCRIRSPWCSAARRRGPAR